MDEAVRRRVLGLLGLGLRGRLAVAGVDRVRDAAKRGILRVAVVAEDASHNAREKVDGLLIAKAIKVILVPSASELGEVAGRDATTIIGVTDAQLAKGILAAAGPAAAVLQGSRRKG